MNVAVPPRTTTVGIIILAAGESSRMGCPKQLLPWQNQPLLRHLANVALQVHHAPVFVVLGAHENIIRPTLDGLPLTIVDNSEWSEGMASSIRHGLAQLTELHPDIGAALFLVCDQPGVTSQLLHELIESWRVHGSLVVASAYGGTTGVPALFDRILFHELLALHGAHGARQVIEGNASVSTTVPFPAGEEDLDTPLDFEKASSQFK